MSLPYGFNAALVAAAAHPQSMEVVTSSPAAGVDAAVGLAMMLTGLSIFISCLAVRRRWYEGIFE